MYMYMYRYTKFELRVFDRSTKPCNRVYCVITIRNVTFFVSPTECAKMLVDMGAQVNIQGTVSLSGVIIHCVHAMRHVARVPSCE